LILPPGVDDVVVIVNKDQPSSIIAYTLSSIEYRDKLGAAAANADVRFSLSLSLVLHTHTHSARTPRSTLVLFLRWGCRAAQAVAALPRQVPHRQQYVRCPFLSVAT
jgi:hypothetical protein